MQAAGKKWGRRKRKKRVYIYIHCFQMQKENTFELQQKVRNKSGEYVNVYNSRNFKMSFATITILVLQHGLKLNFNFKSSMIIWQVTQRSVSVVQGVLDPLSHDCSHQVNTLILSYYYFYLCKYPTPIGRVSKFAPLLNISFHCNLLQRTQTLRSELRRRRRQIE